MKIRLIIVVLTIGLFAGCNDSVKKKPAPILKKKETKAKFKTLGQNSVTGDFNGDKAIDTLTESHSSGKADITQIPFFDEYDDEVDYFYKNDIQTSLQSNFSSNIKSVELGVGFGVYCLINIGDNNKDGKDELALVIDYCDFSLLNSCKIYSYCNGNWKILQQFEVNEGAFMYGKNETTDPNKIRDYLEKKDGKWYFKDYIEYIQAETSHDTIMKLLKIKKCN